MNNILQIFISETINNLLQETSARKGPRTGAFEFEQKIIEKIYNKAAEEKKILSNLKGANKEKITSNKIFRVQIKNPITGKNTYVLVQFFLDPNDQTTGLYYPNTNKIALNLEQLEQENWFKATIAHELTHLFNLKYYHRSTSDDVEKANVYYKSGFEKEAFKTTIVYAMQKYANDIAQQIEKGSEVSLKLGKKITQKPNRLYEKLQNLPKFADVISYYLRNPKSKLLISLDLSAYQIIQNTIVPAIEKVENSKNS